MMNLKLNFVFTLADFRDRTIISAWMFTVSDRCGVCETVLVGKILEA